jgi:hypothetical protein
MIAHIVQRRILQRRRLLMFKKTPAIVGALCALLTTPAFADTMMSTPGSPIQISGCGTQRGPSATGQEPPGSVPAVAWLSFTNTGKQTVDRIAFDIERDGRHYLVTDNGRFAPGAKVDHRVMAGMLPDMDAPASCTVVAIHYADGTSWMR